MQLQSAKTDTFNSTTGPPKVRLHPTHAARPARAAQHQGCSQGDCRVFGQRWRRQEHSRRYVEIQSSKNRNRSIYFPCVYALPSGYAVFVDDVDDVPANLSLAFARMGYRAGILDTDIFGPSIPTLFNLSGEPRLSSSKSSPYPLKATHTSPLPNFPFPIYNHSPD